MNNSVFNEVNNCRFGVTKLCSILLLLTQTIRNGSFLKERTGLQNSNVAQNVYHKRTKNFIFFNINSIHIFYPMSSTITGKPKQKINMSKSAGISLKKLNHRGRSPAISNKIISVYRLQESSIIAHLECPHGYHLITHFNGLLKLLLLPNLTLSER